MKGINILTGPFRSGKTYFCLWFLDALRKGEVDVRGVISPGDYQEGKKLGIWAQDVRLGERRLLAQRGGEGLEIPRLYPWVFNRETISWANSFLKEAVPCQVLIVDELGPLEFEFNQGFVEAFGAISRGQFELALVVIRPELLNAALSLWKRAMVLNIKEAREWGEEVLKGFKISP